jgi:formate C-acetyltransferase
VNHRSLELLKYQSLYVEKARRLGLEPPQLDVSSAEANAALDRAIVFLREQGLEVLSSEPGAPRRQAAFTQRVRDIHQAIRESPHSLCIEASRLKTAFYRKHGFDEPSPIHRAERLAYVLGRKQIIVYPRELLVGNFTTKRKGAQLWEEHFGAALATVVHQIDRQEPIAYQISDEEKRELLLSITPFWLRHSLSAKVITSLRELFRHVARACEVKAGFNHNLAAIAHFVVNYERLLALGTTGLIAEAEAQARTRPVADRDFHRGVVIALQAVETFADRYAVHLAALGRTEADPERRRELEEMAEVCRHVPRNPARTYREALQSMLFLHVALCIESYENAVSPGRLDQILYPYYQRDREAGRIDYAAARELLALFILKLEEAVLVVDGDTFFSLGRLFETTSTDQTVTAGGLGKDGKDATNDLTYALLDICELQPYSVNMTARIHPDSPPEYLDRIAEVYLTGAPMPALYNDEVYVETLTRHYDTTVEDARNYAIIGCTEPNASDDHFGNTDCANLNVALPLLQALRGEEQDLWSYGLAGQVDRVAARVVEREVGGQGRVARALRSGYRSARSWYGKRTTPAPRPPRSLDELLERYQARLNALATAILADHQQIEKAISEDFPTPLASSLSRGCMASGKDVNQGGARHNSSGIQAVGITDVADSLHALDEVVFTRRLYALDEVIEAIESDFAGERRQRIRAALLAVPKFGQDESPEAARWVNRVLQIYVDALKQVPGCPRQGIYAAGYYSLNVCTVYGKKTPALPSGRRAGVPLANGIGPHHGMPAGDLLSALNAVAAVDFAEYAPNGTTLTFTIDSALFQGAHGVRTLAGLFSTFFAQGGMQFQPNVISRELLRDAYAHPEKYPHLLVRIAGYCAYFNQLSDELKLSLINRTCYG